MYTEQRIKMREKRTDSGQKCEEKEKLPSRQGFHPVRPSAVVVLG
jgi:hypothetical protein